MTAEEARSRGTHQALTPVVDVARDPRWGRVEETYGEDPYLVVAHGHRGRARLPGRRDVQGQEARHRHAQALRRARPAGIRHELRACQCLPARAARDVPVHVPSRLIKKADAISVMASYNEVDGVPSHANSWLLRDVLRKEWGFKGFVVSDYYAIWELGYRPDTHGHFVAKDKKESCALAVKAGVNIELPDPDCYLHLVDLVKKGCAQGIGARRTGCARCLSGSSSWGCSTTPTSIRTRPTALWAARRNRELALKAARETITLLKNEGDLLPLDLAKHQDHRCDRAERASLPCWAATAACPSTMSRCSTASRQKRRQARQGALQRRLQDHHRRLLESGRRYRRATPRKTASRSPKR